VHFDNLYLFSYFDAENLEIGNVVTSDKQIQNESREMKTSPWKDRALHDRDNPLF
jgi:hypothetical protein